MRFLDSSDSEPLLPYPLEERKPGSQEYIIPESKRKAVLSKMYPFVDVPELTERQYDLHEGRTFTVKRFKVVREGGKNYLVSPYYYSSGGMVIDWMPASWAKSLNKSELCT